MRTATASSSRTSQYADALTTADRVVTLRYLLSMIAAERGMIATFMPKPFADQTGSGLHLHLSLTSGGAPGAFPADDDAARARTVRNRLRVHRRHPRPRLRAAGSRGTDGQLLQANRRDRPPHRVPPGRRGRRPTAATTAPTTSGCPTPARVELRGGDGSANPYLAIAAALGAGIDGIKRSADPGAVGARHGRTAAAAHAAARGRGVRGRPADHRRPRRRRRGRRGVLRQASSARSSSPTTAPSRRGRSTTT